jgi:hypothetical protein
MEQEITSPDIESNSDHEKVSFTPAQQLQLDEIIRQRLERQKKRDAAQFAIELEEAKKAIEVRVRAELQAEAVERELNRIETEPLAKEYERAKAEAEAAEKIASEIEQEQARLNTETAQLRKDSAMLAAIRKHGFIDEKMIMVLTRDKVIFSEEHKTYVIKDSSGRLRQIQRYEPLQQPDRYGNTTEFVGTELMTLDDFYSEYSQDKGYLVLGTCKSGTGSAESRTHNLRMPARKRDFGNDNKRKAEYISKHGLQKWTDMEL